MESKIVQSNKYIYEITTYKPYRSETDKVYREEWNEIVDYYVYEKCEQEGKRVKSIVRYSNEDDDGEVIYRVDLTRSGKVVRRYANDIILNYLTPHKSYAKNYEVYKTVFKELYEGCFKDLSKICKVLAVFEEIHIHSSKSFYVGDDKEFHEQMRWGITSTEYIHEGTIRVSTYWDGEYSLTRRDSKKHWKGELLVCVNTADNEWEVLLDEKDLKIYPPNKVEEVINTKQNIDKENME